MDLPYGQNKSRGYITILAFTYLLEDKETSLFYLSIFLDRL